MKPEKNPEHFGKLLGEAAKRAQMLFKDSEIPTFLESPQAEFDLKTPLQMIWEHGEEGLRRVIELIKRAESISPKKKDRK